MDPLEYWVGKLKHFPSNSLTVVPNLTAPIEHFFFSTGVDVTSGKRNRLMHKNLKSLFVVLVLIIYHSVICFHSKQVNISMTPFERVDS